MSRRFNKKTAAITVVAVLAVSAAAFGYWTTTGGGTGTGSVGSATARTVTGTIDDSLYPGSHSSVTLTADKDANTTYRIGNITGTVTVGNAYDASTNPAGCKASDFTFTSPAGDQTVVAGLGPQTLTAGSISMSNSVLNQDGCKGASISIALSAAAPTTP
jgi:hypothetical protein